jgi:hypothetical protein
MRFSTVMTVLLVGGALYFIMAVLRAVVIGRMQGLQDEALAYRRKAVRAAVFCAAVLLASWLTGWW